MFIVLRVFRGIPGDLRTLIKHVGVHIILLMPRKQLTEFEKGKIIAWSEDSVSNKEIGRRLKRSGSIIGRFLKLFKATGDHKRLKGGCGSEKPPGVKTLSLNGKSSSAGRSHRVTVF